MTTTTEKKAPAAKTVKKAPAKAKRPELASVANVVLVPLDDLIEVENIREAMDEDALAELARDIEARGLLQPIIVTPAKGNKYQIVAGHRRTAAVRRTAATAVPAVVIKLSGAEAKAAQLAENVQREDLSMLDEGRALLALKNEGMSLAQLAELVNKSRSWVCKRIACVDQLPWPIVDLIEDGITEDPEVILSLKELDQLSYNQLHIACRGMREGTENRETIRERVRKAKEPAPVFDLVGGAGDGEGKSTSADGMDTRGVDAEQDRMPDQAEQEIQERIRKKRSEMQCEAWRLMLLCHGDDEPTAHERAAFMNLEPEAKAYWKSIIGDAVSADPMTLMFKESARLEGLNRPAAALTVMAWAGMNRLAYPTADEVEGLLQRFIDEFRGEVVSHAKQET